MLKEVVLGEPFFEFHRFAAELAIDLDDVGGFVIDEIGRVDRGDGSVGHRLP